LVFLPYLGTAPRGPKLTNLFPWEKTVIPPQNPVPFPKKPCPPKLPPFPGRKKKFDFSANPFFPKIQKGFFFPPSLGLTTKALVKAFFPLAIFFFFVGIFLE